MGWAIKVNTAGRQIMDALGQLVLAQSSGAHANTNLELVFGILLFALAGFAMAFVGLSIGRIARPTQPHPEKATAYECGEPAIGDSWVQFDLRFYTVALVFIVFDVEVALLWPWAVVFKEMGAAAFWPFLVFFLLIAIPFLYEWKSGYLNWVRDSTAQERHSAISDGDVDDGVVELARTRASRDVGIDTRDTARTEAPGPEVNV